MNIFLSLQTRLEYFFKEKRLSISVDILFLLCISILLIGAFLGQRPLANPDEGRYLEIPREMLLTGDFITPRLNGIKYFEKPPFFFWMEAASFSLFGLNAWAGRFVPAFLSILLTLGVYSTGRYLFNRISGLLSALSLLTCSLYFCFAHMVTLDMALTTWVGLGLLAFISGMYTLPSLKRRFLFYASAIFLAFAILTKGLVALAVPGGIIFLWLILYRKWKDLLPFYLPTSFLLFLSITVPWHVVVSLKNPEFAWFYFIREHFLRFITMEHGRHQPFWFFIPVFILGAFPWVCYFPSILFSYLKKKSFPEKEGFFLLWITVFLVFFSLSHSKLIPYILPIYPAFSIIVSQYFMSSSHFSKSSSLNFKGYLLTAFILGITGLLYAFLSEDRTEIPSNFFIFIPFLLTFLLLPCLFYYLLSSLPSNKREFLSIFFGISIFYLGLSYISPLIPYNSTKNIARYLKKEGLDAKDFVFYKSAPYDLLFYLNKTQPIPLVSWTGELSYGMQNQDTSGWTWPEESFWTRWNSSRPLCMVLKQTIYTSLYEEGKITKQPIQLPTNKKNIPMSPYVVVCNF